MWHLLVVELDATIQEIPMISKNIDMFGDAQFLKVSHHEPSHS